MIAGTSTLLRRHKYCVLTLCPCRAACRKLDYAALSGRSWRFLACTNMRKVASCAGIHDCGDPIAFYIDKQSLCNSSSVLVPVTGIVMSIDVMTQSLLPARSISTVYRALCTQTQETVIVKVYDRAKMKPKNFARLEREVSSSNTAANPNPPGASAGMPPSALAAVCEHQQASAGSHQGCGEHSVSHRPVRWPGIEM